MELFSGADMGHIIFTSLLISLFCMCRVHDIPKQKATITSPTVTEHRSPYTDTIIATVKMFEILLRMTNM